jgi:hypothetical protein
MSQLTFNNETVKKILSDHQLTEKQVENAISEYIWNGLDADASIVELNYELGGPSGKGEPRIRSLIVKDNGSGIDYYKLNQKFAPFYDSEKSNISVEDRHHSTLHGKNGIGRLAFFAFAKNAKWTTVFQNSDNKRLKYTIEISDNTIKEYKETEPKDLIKTDEPTGTIVEFSNFKRLISHSKGTLTLDDEIITNLKREFCWKLELLNKYRKTEFVVNSELFKYEDIINERESFTKIHPESGTEFKVDYIQWKHPLVKEFSRFYFLNSNGIEVYKETTGLNNKGDSFYHSVFIQSNYFDYFEFEPQTKITNSADIETKASTKFRYLDKEIRQYLRQKRVPFLREYSNVIIKEFYNKGYLTRRNASPADIIEIEDLETVIKELYVIEPRIFSELGAEQTKTLLALFRLILNSKSREQIFPIIDKIVGLDQEERIKFNKILGLSELNRIINTIDLVQERFKVIESIRKIVFGKKYANERDHLQKAVEPNYWIFGEQYNLVAAATADFNRALENFLYILDGEKKKANMQSPNKKKRVDIFLCRQDKQNEITHNIIVEIKHPDLPIGEKQLSQVMGYLDTIIHEKDFNAKTYRWDFYLIGGKFTDNGYIERILENNKDKGVLGLAFEISNYRIFVKTWSDVLNQCDLRLNFLNEQLKVKKDELVKAKSVEEVVQSAKDSSAALV